MHTKELLWTETNADRKGKAMLQAQEQNACFNNVLQGISWLMSRVLNATDMAVWSQGGRRKGNSCLGGGDEIASSKASRMWNSAGTSWHCSLPYCQGFSLNRYQQHTSSQHIQMTHKQESHWSVLRSLLNHKAALVQPMFRSVNWSRREDVKHPEKGQ